MAKRVANLEEQAADLAVDVFCTIPRQYLDKSNPRDPINRAWNIAVNTAASAMIEMERLGDLMRERAGITEPGPLASLCSGCGEGETGAAETAGDDDKGG